MTVLVSATTRTGSAGGGDLGVDLLCGERRLECEELAQRIEQAIDGGSRFSDVLPGDRNPGSRERRYTPTGSRRLSEAAARRSAAP
jgi:hypothetical protein